MSLLRALSQQAQLNGGPPQSPPQATASACLGHAVSGPPRRRGSVVALQGWGIQPATPARPELVGDASRGCTWTWPQAAEAWFAWRKEGNGARPSWALSSSPVFLPLLGPAQHTEVL